MIFSRIWLGVGRISGFRFHRELVPSQSVWVCVLEIWGNPKTMKTTGIEEQNLTTNWSTNPPYTKAHATKIDLTLDNCLQIALLGHQTAKGIITKACPDSSFRMNLLMSVVLPQPLLPTNRTLLSSCS